MKHLRIKFTSKFEAEYFESRLEQKSLAFKKYDMNETDTEYDIECRDIRIGCFRLGQMVFDFLRNHYEPVMISIRIMFVDKFDIWDV